MSGLPVFQDILVRDSGFGSFQTAGITEYALDISKAVEHSLHIVGDERPVALQVFLLLIGQSFVFCLNGF